MNAIQIDRFGAPSVLRPVVIERPTPAPDEVLVRVTRIGLNFAETLQRAGTYPPGADFAGDIGIGNGRHRRSGRRERAGLPRRRSRGRGAVRRNERNRRLCRICDGTRSADRRDSRRRFGRRRRRGHAAGAGRPHAAARDAGGRAIRRHHRRSRRRRFDAHPAGETRRCQDDRRPYRFHGEAIDGAGARCRSGRELSRRRVGRSTGRCNRRHGPDVVFDSIGGAVARTLASSLAPHGRFVAYGAASGQLLAVDDSLMNALIFGCRSLSGFALHAFLADHVVQQTLGELFGLLATGALKPLIGAAMRSTRSSTRMRRSSRAARPASSCCVSIDSASHPPSTVAGRLSRRHRPRTKRRAANHHPGAAHTGVNTGRPEKCRSALSMNCRTDRSSASGDQPPMCGVSTTLSRSVSARGGSGSPSYTSAPRPRCVLHATRPPKQRYRQRCRVTR